MTCNKDDKVLYKYYSLAEKDIGYTLAVLEGGYVWLANPAEFSDCFDNPLSFSKHFNIDPFPMTCNTLRPEHMRETYKYLKDEREKYENTVKGDRVFYWGDEKLHHPLVNKFMNIWEEIKPNYRMRCTIDGLRSFLFNELGICCFTSDNGNPFMWDKYASGYSGLCAEFAFDEYRFPKKIEYSKEKAIKTTDDETNELRPSLIGILKNPTKFDNQFFVKTKEYLGEQEYRHLEYFVPSHYNQLFPTSDDEKEKRKREQYKPRLKSICFGYRTTRAMRKICCRLVAQDVEILQFESDPYFVDRLKRPTITTTSNKDPLTAGDVVRYIDKGAISFNADSKKLQSILKLLNDF